MSEQGKNEKSAPAKDQKDKKKGPGIGGKLVKWFKELKSETKKIIWPTFGQVVNNTAVVIVTIAVIGAFIWAFDFGLARGNAALLSLVGK